MRVGLEFTARGRSQGLDGLPVLLLSLAEKISNYIWFLLSSINPYQHVGSFSSFSESSSELILIFELFSALLNSVHARV